MLSPVADAARSAPSATRTGTKSSDSGPSADLFASMVDGGERVDDPSPSATGSPVQAQRSAGDAPLAPQGNAKPAIITGAAAIAAAILPQLQAAQGQDTPAEPAPQTLPPDPALANPGADTETAPDSGSADGDSAQSANAEPTTAAPPSVPADTVIAIPFGGMALATAVVASQQPTDTTPASEQPAVGAVAEPGINSALRQAEAPSLQPGMTAAASTGLQPQGDTAGLPVSATPDRSPVTPNSEQMADIAADVQTSPPANSGDAAPQAKPALGANQATGTDRAGNAPAATDTGLRAQTGEARTAAAAQSHTAASNLTASAHEKTNSAARHESAAESAAAVPAATVSAQPASVNMANWTHLTASPMIAPVTAGVMIDAAGNASQITTGSVPLTGLAVEIASRAVAGNTRFEIRLDPPDLGRIDVRLDVDSKGQVTSHLTVERTDTLDLLRRDAPQLQRALQDAGLKTGDGALQFSLRDQSSGNGTNADDGSRRRADQILIQTDEAAPAEITSRGYGRLIGSAGGLDIRV